ncbi:Fluoroquinolones export permease protein [Bacillus sp. THAF10]|uniref:fluoroquinolone export ABC transporter permease subunit n=1 Tax=Bacillus sp. THAF10 TaxID=2587848 RepID=UPI001267D091|nr:hypothetical protein [Bacillus sp. THAF10]QFT89704.1 Fluoroquinolones export permease protein [Bacillus sp. THAF10]
MKMLWTDIRFQYKHGFYFAYLFMVLVYVLLLAFLPNSYQQELTVLIVFTDPSVLGCFFIGGIILLEKSQKVYGPLFITGLSIGSFLISKILSLALISVLSSLAIMLFVHQLTFHIFPFVVGVVLSSIVFTLLGLLLAVRVRTVNQFLFSSPLLITVFFLPVVSIFVSWDSFLLKVLPSYGGIVLIQGAFQTLSWQDWLYSISILSIWSVGLFYLATYSFKVHVLHKGEGVT